MYFCLYNLINYINLDGWFGNKSNNYQPLLSNGVNLFTGDSFEEIVGELTNMANITYDCMHACMYIRMHIRMYVPMYTHAYMLRPRGARILYSTSSMACTAFLVSSSLVRI